MTKRVLKLITVMKNDHCIKIDLFVEKHYIGNEMFWKEPIGSFICC